jgi:glycosyltransferase involved in cell wall biosynthesis
VIYICIPAHNEAETAGVLLWKIRQVMAEFKRDYLVLFLDDASTDRTLEVVSPYVQVLPLDVMRNEQRQGHGASLEKLMIEAVNRSSYPRRDVVVTLQADFTDSPTAVPPLVKRVEGGADLVIAAQPPDGSRVPLTVRCVRRALTWLERKYEFPKEVSDPISGLRAYRVGLIKKTLKVRNGERMVKHDGWAASVELLLAVAPHTRRVEELVSAPRYDLRIRGSRLSFWHAARDYIALLRGL